MSTLPATEQGRNTRERIVRAAADLIGERGAAATSLDDVRAATGASKSQLYHYFGDKRGLLEAVVSYQCASVLGFQAQALGAVGDWGTLEQWARGLAAATEEQRARGGCPLGTLAAALSDTDEELRVTLSEAFTAWSDAIRGALIRLRSAQLIRDDADLEALTKGTLAAIQGGLLLAKASRDVAFLRAALDGAVAHIRAQAPGRAPERAGITRP